MHLALISRDDFLKRLCREVLATLPGRWRLSIATPDEAVPPADLCLWDWEEQMRLPGLLAAQAPGCAHILAMDRDDARHLAEMLEGIPGYAMTLVLKPVNPDALRTFLEQAVGRIGSLRHDRDAILDCLLATTLRLQEFDQDRMNFLARAVHDFRTPLTAVNGYCGLLLSGQFGPLTTAQKEVLERTLHSIRRLSRLATALFQWSSGVRVGLQSRIREADIEECCRQALHEVRPLAGEKTISFDLDLQAPGQPLQFDTAQMEQLLVNLLENSCKFTPRGGYILVRGFPAFWERRTAAVSRDTRLWIAGGQPRGALTPTGWKFPITAWASGPNTCRPSLRSTPRMAAAATGPAAAWAWRSANGLWRSTAGRFSRNRAIRA